MDLNPLVGVAADRANIASICGLTTAVRLDPLHRSLLAMAPRIRERLRACVEDRVRLQGNSTLLGLDFGSVGFAVVFPVLSKPDGVDTGCPVDASPNFINATIFNDSPTSGFGGWGDPANDYQIMTGAFAKNFEVAYPVPHAIRRNYTSRSANPNPFGDGTPGAPDAFWNYFTRESQDTLINGYIGDFEGFQTQLEGPVVS